MEIDQDVNDDQDAMSPSLAFKRFTTEYKDLNIQTAEEGMIVFVLLGTKDGATSQFLSSCLSTDLTMPMRDWEYTALMLILLRGMALQWMLEDGLKMDEQVGEAEKYLRQSTNALNEIRRRAGMGAIEHDPAYCLSVLKHIVENQNEKCGKRHLPV